MKRYVGILMALLLTVSTMILPAAAEPSASGSNNDNSALVHGKIYTFDEDNDYEFSARNEFESTETATPFGTFRIAGQEAELVGKGEKDGVPAFSVENGNIVISYTYTDKLLNAPDEEIHLVADDENDVDVIELENDVEKGALILQRSIDHKNWHNVSVQTNAFETTPIQTEAMYTTTEPEMENGCYYRLIVAYKTAIKGDPMKILGLISKDTYTYQRIAEVYEFYAALENAHIVPLQPNEKRYSLGETVKVEHSASYSGQSEIKNGDLHYGWELGQFFVSGYTEQKKNEDGNIVFLKNVGDVVTLWFNLKQDIDALNGDKDVSIAFDKEGSDQYFQTPNTLFGRGMLIIRYTDHENVKHNPVMYYDYLAANTSIGADTRAQLFEEGDYEVALDYEIEKDGFAFLGSTGHYRTSFKFSVRNANCMVYPFDIATGAELTNSSMTENGFYLDLARSRYLTINVKKEVLTESMDGLTEDVRFNTIAKDGDHYTEEGIYTIIARNNYTGNETTKKIYVGTTPILKAYMTTGYSLQELTQKVNDGWTIYEDGSIEPPADVPATEAETETVLETIPETEPVEQTKPPVATTEPVASPEVPAQETKDTEGGNAGTIVGIAAAVAAVVGIGGGLSLKKRRARERDK